jgi:hypothetical protein
VEKQSDQETNAEAFMANEIVPVKVKYFQMVPNETKS